MGALTGLSGLSGLTGVVGDGGGAVDQHEYQQLRFTTMSGDPSTVYGKLRLIYMGNSEEFDYTSGFLDAASAQSIFDALWGSGNVEATDATKGYDFKFVGDLENYDIPEPSVGLDGSYPLNTGDGAFPFTESTQDYVAPSDGNPEVVDIEINAGGGDENYYTQDSNGNIVSYDSLSAFTASPSAGWSITSGEGTNVVRFTSNSNQAYGTVKVTGDGTVTRTIDGSSPVDKIQGRLVISWSKTTGWVNYDSIVIPSGSDDTAVTDALNAILSGTVQSASMGSTSLTVLFNDGSSPGSPSIGGRFGDAITATYSTLQNGVLEYPPPIAWYKNSIGSVFQTSGGAAADTGDPVGQSVNSGLSGIDATQTGSARPTLSADVPTALAGDDSRSLSFDGSNDYLNIGDLDLDYGTIAAWVKIQGGAWGWVVCKSYDGVMPFFLELGANEAGGIGFFEGGYVSSGLGGVDVRGSGWRHVCGTFDGANLKYFVDGELKATFIISDRVFPTNNQQAVIGARADAGYCTTGLITDVRVYDVVLSDEKIAAIAAGPT